MTPNKSSATSLSHVVCDGRRILRGASQASSLEVQRPSEQRHAKGFWPQGSGTSLPEIPGRLSLVEENSKTKQRKFSPKRKFLAGYPCGHPAKNFGQALQILEKQAFWNGHPARTSMKKLRSEKLRADFPFSTKTKQKALGGGRCFTNIAGRKKFRGQKRTPTPKKKARTAPKNFLKNSRALPNKTRVLRSKSHQKVHPKVRRNLCRESSLGYLSCP